MKEIWVGCTLCQERKFTRLLPCARIETVILKNESMVVGVKCMCKVLDKKCVVVAE